jgi:hypothetical protein
MSQLEPPIQQPESAGQHTSHKFWWLMHRVPNSMGEARPDGDPVP